MTEPVSEEGTIDVGARTRVWSVGWQWPWAVILAAMLGGNFLFAADRTVLGIGVLVAGLGIVVAGVRAVNRHSGDAFADGMRSVRRAVADELDLDDPSTIHPLAVGSDSVVGFDRSKRYDLAVVTLGESALTVHHDGSMDMLSRTWTVGEQTERIPYEDVRSVTEGDGTLRLELVDGEVKSIPVDSRPDDLLAALGRRLGGSDAAE